MSEHRDSAEHSLVQAQRNPIQSAGELFSAAQVHALLAIEQKLDELLALLRSGARLEPAS
jgi:hypothetical protein